MRDCVKIILTFLFVVQIRTANCVKILGLVVPPLVDLQDESVNLDCKYELKEQQLYSVKWYKDEQEFFRFLPVGATLSFPLPGVTVKKEEITAPKCNLQHCAVSLTHLSRSTEGSYRCEISTEAPTFRLYFDTANISIIALPRGPVTIATPKRDYSEGEEIWVNCTSPPADPPPKIQWYINNKILEPSAIISQSDSAPDDRGLIVRSLAAHLTATRDLYLKNNNLLILRCEVRAPAQLPLYATVEMTLFELREQKFDWLSSSGSSSSSNYYGKALHCLLFTTLISIVSFYTKH